MACLRVGKNLKNPEETQKLEVTLTQSDGSGEVLLRGWKQKSKFCKDATVLLFRRAGLVLDAVLTPAAQQNRKDLFKKKGERSSEPVDTSMKTGDVGKKEEKETDAQSTTRG